MLTKQMMRQGKPGLFGMIERSTNLRNSRVFVALNVILFIISLVVRFTVWELEMGSCFMWLSAGMLLVSLAELLIVQRKAGKTLAADAAQRAFLGRMTEEQDELKSLRDRLGGI